MSPRVVIVACSTIGATALAICAMFVLFRTGSSLTRPVEPSVDRAQFLEPIDLARSESLSSRDSTLRFVRNEHGGHPVGSCDAGSTEAIAAIIAASPIGVEEGIAEVPSRGFMRLVPSLAADVLALLDDDDSRAAVAAKVITDSVGREAGAIADRIGANFRQPLRIHRVLAVPPEVDASSVRVKRQDDEDASSPIEVNILVHYQTSDGTDRQASVGFVLDKSRDAWLLRSVGTMPDRHTLTRLFDDIEAQNALIQSVYLSPLSEVGTLGVRRGKLMVIKE